MKPRDLVIDAETESNEDIRLGAYAYNNHPSTRTLCFSWRFLDEPPGTERIWYPGKVVNPTYQIWKLCGEHGAPPPVFMRVNNAEMPAELAESIARGDRWHAHNAFFERCWWDLVMVRHYGWPEIPFDTWHCSAALSAYHGYSQSLERAGLGLGVDVIKDTDGGRLMKAMTAIGKRKKKTIINWAENLYILGEYCKTDVGAEADIIQALPPLPEYERKLWLLDQQINWHGLPLDRELAEAGAASSDLIQADAAERLPELTGGLVTKPGQVARIKKFVEESTGRSIPNLQAGTVYQLLKSDIDENVKEVLRIRQDAGTAAIKKFVKELSAIKYDRASRFHGGFVYYGAHTGRWTGKIVQPTNMPRAHFNSDSETEKGILAIKSGSLRNMEECDAESLLAAEARAAAKGKDFEPWRPTATNTLTKCVRASITAPEGYTLVANDFAGIELRVLTWFAKDKDGLNRIIEHGSSQLYLDMAEAVFGRTITKADSFEYTVGKAGRLGCGYGMGPYKKEKDVATGLWVPAKDEYGKPFGGFVEYAANFGIEITEDTLELADRVVKTYRKENKKVVKLWDLAQKYAVSVVETGYPKELNGVKFSKRGDALVLRLPSGRELFYPKIRVSEKKGRKSLSYMGDKSGKWVRLYLYGGLIIENIVQAMSRDILTPAMLAVAERYPIVSHCYDEIVAEVLKRYADECDKYMVDVMCRSPWWCADLPLEAEGWISRRYKK